MHKVSYYDGDAVIDWHDWSQADPTGIRYVRRDGYEAAITAELIRTAIGWVGTSWRLQPVRSTIPIQAECLDWAVRTMELAEQEGHASATWAPRTKGADGILGERSDTEPGTPRQEYRMHKGRAYIYLERFGSAGTSCWTVHISGEIQLDAAGGPMFFDNLEDAIEFYERED
jgi:hypothetical protein